jgi:very-short-patch-repair endonuclease
MELPSSKTYAKALPRARRLRRLETEAEKILWRLIRARQLEGRKFRGQVPIGPYVADFFCLESKLIIEVDGGQHAAAIEADDARSAYMGKFGYKVIRFWNNAVLQNPQGVLQRIVEALDNSRAVFTK